MDEPRWCYSEAEQGSICLGAYNKYLEVIKCEMLTDAFTSNRAFNILHLHILYTLSICVKGCSVCSECSLWCEQRGTERGCFVWSPVVSMLHKSGLSLWRLLIQRSQRTLHEATPFSYTMMCFTHIQQKRSPPFTQQAEDRHCMCSHRLQTGGSNWSLGKYKNMTKSELYRRGIGPGVNSFFF